MAKKSNKTAHVLNLLSGHDTAKETEDTPIEDELSNPVAEDALPPASAEPKTAAGREEPVLESSGSASPRHTPVSAKAPAASQSNNISLIDKTGGDPVADLIQEKLSDEFEKQMQESLPDSFDAAQAETDAASDSAEAKGAVSGSVSATDEKSGSGAALGTHEGSGSDTVFDADDESKSDAVFDSDAKISLNAASDLNIEIDSDTASDAGTAPDTAPSADKGTSSAAVSGQDEPEAARIGSAPLKNASSVLQPEEAGSEDNSDLQEALNLNTIESANALSETEEEMEAMAEMDVDLKAEPKAAEPAVPEPEPEPEFSAVNVMERIVNDKIIYYMRQFDVCTCDRCKADVIALTLNGLLPKYIVTMPAAVDPLISYYTNRLISDVTVEATKACMVVKENPRH